MTSRISVGIDCGFGQTKAGASNGREVCFPSLVSPFGTDSLDDQLDSHFVDIDGKNYIVGEDALNIGTPLSTDVDSQWFKKQHFRICFLHALHQLGVAKQPVRLVTGLPVDYHKDFKDNVRNLIARWNEYGYDIDVLEVLPQPVGSVLNLGVQDDGELSEPYLSGSIGIIDIGNGTVDCIQVSAMKIHRQHRSTEKNAISEIHKRIIAHVNQKYSVTITPARASAILRTGKFSYNGKPQPIENKLKAFKKEIADAIAAQVNKTWRDELAMLDKLVFTGGGAEVLRDELSKQFPKDQLVFPDNPTMCNAHGYLRFLTKAAPE